MAATLIVMDPLRAALVALAGELRGVDQGAGGFRAGCVHAADKIDAILATHPAPGGEAVAWLIEYRLRAHDHRPNGEQPGDIRRQVFLHNAIGDYRAVWPDATSTPLFTHPAPSAAVAVTVDDVFAHCTVIHWPMPLGTYPIEHNLKAAKDQKREILAAIAAAGVPALVQTIADRDSEIHDLVGEATERENELGAWKQRAQSAEQRAAEADAEVSRLSGLLNSPELHDFSRGVELEAAHQRERWGNEHDAGKTAADWFWLVGYLAGKALHSQTAGNLDKARHHTISTAAELANWHGAIEDTHNMRPGIDGDSALSSGREVVR
jgi:hypothetical protein